MDCGAATRVSGSSQAKWLLVELTSSILLVMNASNLSVSDPGFDLSFSGLLLPSPPPDAPGSGGGGAGGPGGGGGGGMLAREVVAATV